MDLRIINLSLQFDEEVTQGNALLCSIYFKNTFTATSYLQIMAVHMVALAKIKLLSCGLSSWQLFALLVSFVMKLPFAIHMPASLGGLIVSTRFFLYQLNRILFRNTMLRRDQRWERTFRLLHERAFIDSRSEIWSYDDSLNLSIMML